MSEHLVPAERSARESGYYFTHLRGVDSGARWTQYVKKAYTDFVPTQAPEPVRKQRAQDHAEAIHGTHLSRVRKDGYVVHVVRVMHVV